jgi:hypothetical protein
MPGILRVDQANVDYIYAKTSGGTTYIPGHIIQVQTVSTNNRLAGTLGASTNPTSTSGTSYVTLSFTPKSAASKLWLTTSPVMIEELSNSGNDFWLAAFYDTTRIGCVSGSAFYTHFASYYNLGWYGLNVFFNSWGTSTKTVDFRVGGGGGSGANMYINYGNSSMDTSTMNYGFTIAEIAQ